MIGPGVNVDMVDSGWSQRYGKWLGRRHAQRHSKLHLGDLLRN